MRKFIVIGAVVVVLGGMIAFSVRQAVRKGTRVYEEEAKTVATLVSSVKASGEIQPKVYVNISSQVPGQIVDLRVKEGDRVRTGDVLLQLDPEQYRSTVVRLEANLRMARINLERERTSLRTYEANLRRQEALAKDQIVSDEALDQTRLQRDTSEITIRAYEEQIRQAEADLLKAKDELAKTTIKAPIDGLVTRVNAKLGEQVIIGTMNNPGTVILVLSDMSEMLAEVRVDETEVAGVRPGQSAVVTVDAVEDRKFDGVVAEIAHTAVKENNVSRFTVKVSLTGAQASPAAAAQAAGPAAEIPAPERAAGLPDFAGKLRPGMSAHAAIQVAARSDVLVVPLQAIVPKKRSEVDELLRAAEPRKPSKENAAGSIAAEGTGAGPGDANAATGAAAGKPEGRGAADREEVDVIFLDRGGAAAMLEVRTGLSDEFTVELIGSGVSPGDKVVVGPYRTLKKLKPGEAITRAKTDEELKDQD